jgi:hypothetical protein
MEKTKTIFFNFLQIFDAIVEVNNATSIKLLFKTNKSTVIHFSHDTQLMLTTAMHE